MISANYVSLVFSLFAIQMLLEAPVFAFVCSILAAI